MITGIVVKNMNGYFYVQDDTGTIHECKVRGRLKQGRYSLLVGDRVTISMGSLNPSMNVIIRWFALQ
jgi:ribosome biogenesis GTPase